MPQFPASLTGTGPTAFGGQQGVAGQGGGISGLGGPATQQGFLQSLLANPDSAQFLLRLGAQLMQPIQPGGNTAGHIGSALTGSLDFLQGQRKNRINETLLGLDAQSKQKRLELDDQRQELAGKREERIAKAEEKRVSLEEQRFQLSLADREADLPVKAIQRTRAVADLELAKARTSELNRRPEEKVKDRIAAYDRAAAETVAKAAAFDQDEADRIRASLDADRNVYIQSLGGGVVAGQGTGGDTTPPPNAIKELSLADLPIPLTQMKSVSDLPDDPAKIPAGTWVNIDGKNLAKMGTNGKFEQYILRN